MALKNIYNCMSYAAGNLQSTVPSNTVLQMLPMTYLSSGWYTDPNNSGTSTVSLTDTQNLADALAAQPLVLDFEPWLDNLLTVDGGGNPVLASEQVRLLNSQKIADVYRIIASRPNGAAALAQGFCFYASLIGGYVDANPQSWHTAYRIFHNSALKTPYPFAPQGISALATKQVVSLYRLTSDVPTQIANMRGVVQEARRTYPNQTIAGFFFPRNAGSYNVTKDRFDFMPHDIFMQLFSVAYEICDEIIMWDANIYGAAGTPCNYRDSNGYARASTTAPTGTGTGITCAQGTGSYVPASWDSTLPWYTAYKEFIRSLPTS